MSFSGRYTTIGVVLDKIKVRSGASINESDAAEWIADLMSTLAPYSILHVVVTDGNPNDNNPQPIEVKEYRAELPCDIVELMHIIDLKTFTQLRSSSSPAKIINFSKNPNFNYKSINPSSTGSPDAYQLKNGYIYTDFEEGHLVLVYRAWPRDQDGNFLIPADRPVIDAFAWHIQEQIDYFLWRSGEIADKVFQVTQQNSLWAKGKAVSFINAESDGEMYSTTNIWSTPLSRDNFFRTAYASMGRQIAERIH